MIISYIALAVLIVAAYAPHFVYPMALRSTQLLSRPMRVPEEKTEIIFDDHDWSQAQIIIPAYKESGVLAETIAALKDDGVPPKSITIYVDEDLETLEAARGAGVIVKFNEKRQGKSGAINQAISAYQNKAALLVIDANSRLTPGGPKALLARVMSGGVVACSAVKIEEDNGEESAYWRFERSLIASENALGGSLALVGEALAFCPKTITKIPNRGVNDDQYIAVESLIQGRRSWVDTHVKARESSCTRTDQRERRIRMIENSMRLVWLERKRLLKCRDARLPLYFMHKYWRITIGPAAQWLILAYCVAAFSTPLMAVVLIAHVAAIIIYTSQTRFDRSILPGPFALLGSAIGMPMIVVPLAFIRFLANREGAVAWRKIAR